MSKPLTLTALTALLAALFAPSAHAQQAYAGAAVAGGTLHYRAPGVAGAPEVDDHILFGRLYGGYAFNDTFALEGGWAATGTARYARAETGAPYDVSFKSNLVYAALRATYHVNEDWSVAAKLGAARHFQRQETGKVVERHHAARPMVGIGTSYNLTPNAALTLDLTHYGTVRTSNTLLRVVTLEAGVRFGF